MTATATTPSLAPTSIADIRELPRLAGSPAPRDRLRAATHPCVDGAAAVKLALDISVAVRCAIAANPATPSSVLIDLAYDTHPDVRLAVAANPSASIQALEALREDTVPFVRIAAGVR